MLNRSPTKLTVRSNFWSHSHPLKQSKINTQAYGMLPQKQILRSLTWPDPSSHRGIIACTISAPTNWVWNSSQDLLVQTLPKCQYAQKINILWFSLLIIKVLISSKQILITQLRMTHHWISWSIYTHHHSDGSCTSGCCELFQTQFAWGTYTASDNAPGRSRVWPCEIKFCIDVVSYLANSQFLLHCSEQDSSTPAFLIWRHFLISCKVLHIQILPDKFIPHQFLEWDYFVSTEFSILYTIYQDALSYMGKLYRSYIEAILLYLSISCWCREISSKVEISQLLCSARLLTNSSVTI